MGLPIEQLIVATNRNDILARFFQSGEYVKGTVHPTMSPSMDIQVSSNFERLLFDIEGRDGDRVRALMTALDQSGGFTVDAERLTESGKLIDGLSIDEETTLKTIAAVQAESGQAVDPHSAIAVAAGRIARRNNAVAMISLATAHPAKFPDAVEKATGQRPELPSRLADLLQREEKFEVMANDLAAVKARVRDLARV